MDLTRIIEGANGDLIVLSRSNGAWLGVLSDAHFSPETRALSSITFRHNGSSFVVPIEAVETLGQDVIIIRDRDDAQAVTAGEEIPGRALRALRELVVTTQSGDRLGRLQDVRFDRESGRLRALLLDQSHALDVSPDEVMVGRDEILVPAECAGRLRDRRRGELGVLARMSTGSAVGDVVTGVRRIMARTG